MIGWLKSLLPKKKKKKAHTQIKDLVKGQMVEVKFRHPTEVGIFDKNTLTCTRFNPHELKNRCVHGFVKQVAKWSGGPNFGNYLVVESSNTEGNRREYLFLQSEIKSIRILE
jgi:hypothetical protein